VTIFNVEPDGSLTLYADPLAGGVNLAMQEGEYDAQQIHARANLGSVVGTVLGAIMSPVQTAKKPLMERGAEALEHTTRDLMRGARRARKRIMKKLD
jgi:hypothetical protein